MTNFYQHSWSEAELHQFRNGNESERCFPLLIPFLGGVLIGGMFAPKMMNSNGMPPPGYYPPPNQYPQPQPLPYPYPYPLPVPYYETQAYSPYMTNQINQPSYQANSQMINQYSHVPLPSNTLGLDFGPAQAL